MSAAALRMAFGARRLLSEDERAKLSPGLLAALERAGARPTVAARPSLPALAVGLWRRAFPIMVLGQTIFWPRARGVFTAPSDLQVLQHELQHVLDFATGELTRVGYVTTPRNWTYRYRLTESSAWVDFGAEQRAMLAQHYWAARYGPLADPVKAAKLARVIPWAEDG